ncbi:acyl-CoA synthetase [Parasulfuritortus cantonensis]|uniref:Acyl-CoA synthetase n=1 Tax=Parasulfuritortus cantonensis TaxID=2528202 RepID=A0A4R1BF96_9PROT|nr:acyl-CoA synthetase [Parasulfuritortus cantonensis]TCJ15777.1 acyl-CoA synthetase [Parasulfuritortus cantonensis]
MTTAARDPDKQTPPEWLRRKERGSAFWIRVMRWLSLTLGRRLSRLVLYAIAFYFTLAASAARTASRAYLTRVLQRPVRWLDLYRHVLAFSSTVHDRIYLLNDRYDLFDIRVDGAEPLRALHSTGQGCLLFGAHLGSFEVLRGIARGNDGLKVSAAMYPENARLLNDTLAAINPGVVLDVIPLGRLEAMMTIHQRLQDGAMVGILADRASGADRYRPLPFLGTTALFPTGPFRMAVMLRQPVFFMAGLYRGGNRYDIHFEPLEDFAEASAAGRDDRVQALLEKYVAALERHCRAAPYNWFNFYDFWNPVGREDH